MISGDVAYSYMGSDDARPLGVLFFGQISRVRLKQPPQAVPLALVLGEIVSILGQTMPIQSRSGINDGLVDGFGRGSMMWIFQRKQRICDHSGFHPQVFLSCACLIFRGAVG